MVYLVLIEISFKGMCFLEPVDVYIILKNNDAGGWLKKVNA